MMGPSCLVVHRTKRRGSAEGFVAHGDARCALLPPFPITLLRVRLQFGRSVVPQRSFYVGISRCSAHAAEHCMRSKDEMWMCCWPLKPHATLGVSTSRRPPRVAARMRQSLEALEVAAAG